MNNTRRTVIKTTSAFGTFVALGLVTQQQAMAAVDRAAFDVSSQAPGPEPVWRQTHVLPGGFGESHRAA